MVPSAETNKKKRKGLFSVTEVLLMTVPVAAVASLNITLAPLFAGLQITGNAGECPMNEALRVQTNIELMNETTREIQDASTVSEPEEGTGLVLWKTPHGEFWAPAGDSVPFLLSEQIHRFYGDGERRVQPGDVVIDGGANIGAFVWEALNAGAGLVVAVEPSQWNVESLRRNFAEEIAEGRVIVYPKGIWHEDDQLTFNTFENSTLDSIVMDNRLDLGATKVTIDVTTVDHLVEELGLEKVDYIKMDIEGAERNALEGSRATIAKFRPRLSIATENLDDDPVVIPALVEQIRSDYERQCGRCSIRSTFQIAPDAFYFF